ncbi:phospholipase A and acyltransferase 3-like [Spinachia spinachia]
MWQTSCCCFVIQLVNCVLISAPAGSKRYVDMAPTMSDEQPEPGDLIEIYRGVYQHWAVYVGRLGRLYSPLDLSLPEDEGVGVSASSGLSAAKTAMVKKEKLWSVVGKSKWSINNSLDKKHKPRPARVIVREACAMVGAVLPYCVFSQNCEHFANELRYGKAESRQVANAEEATLFGGLVAVLGVLGGVGLALSGGSRR